MKWPVNDTYQSQISLHYYVFRVKMSVYYRSLICSQIPIMGQMLYIYISESIFKIKVFRTIIIFEIFNDM